MVCSRKKPHGCYVIYGEAESYFSELSYIFQFRHHSLQVFIVIECPNKDYLSSLLSGFTFLNDPLTFLNQFDNHLMWEKN